MQDIDLDVEVPLKDLMEELGKGGGNASKMVARGAPAWPGKGKRSHFRWMTTRAAFLPWLEEYVARALVRRNQGRIDALQNCCPGQYQFAARQSQRGGRGNSVRESLADIWDNRPVPGFDSRFASAGR